MASSALDEKILDEKVVNLATLVVHEAADAHVSVASAESCTGGLVAGALTAVPGSSEVLLGSVVSYAISIKQKVLGVSKEIFDDPQLGQAEHNPANPLERCGSVFQRLWVLMLMSCTLKADAMKFVFKR